MTETIKLFPIIIFRDFYPRFQQLKDNLFPKLSEIFEETKHNNNLFMRDGTLCSYHTNSYIHKQFPEETEDVVDFIESSAKRYWDECRYHKDLTPYVFQLWANSTPGGGWIHSHLHGNMPFTGVIYIDASPEQGNLMIENPMDMILMSQPISPDVKYPMAEELKVKSGDLIMFPGYIKHSVKPNKTDVPRLILGFNIGCYGKYWTNQWTQDK
jgi:uncharacterized protein (TIGR02466 family)